MIWISCTRQASNLRPSDPKSVQADSLLPLFSCQSSAEAHKKENLSPTQVDAIALICELPFTPTIIVHSGNGIHAYWLFSELWQLETTEARESAKSTVEKWQRLLKEKAEAHGWANDSTFDLARVYRVAGTKNRKDPKKPKAVEIIELNETALYKREELIDHVATLKVSDHRTKQMSEIKSKVAAMGALILDASRAKEISALDVEMLADAEPKFRKNWDGKRREPNSKTAKRG